MAGSAYSGVELSNLSFDVMLRKQAGQAVTYLSTGYLFIYNLFIYLVFVTYLFILYLYLHAFKLLGGQELGRLMEVHSHRVERESQTANHLTFK